MKSLSLMQRTHGCSHISSPHTFPHVFVFLLNFCFYSRCPPRSFSFSLTFTVTPCSLSLPVSLLAPSLSLPSPSFLNSAPWWRSDSAFFFYLPGFSFPAFLPLEKTGNYKPITFFFFFNTPTTSNYLCSRMSNRNSVCVSANLTRLTPLIR